MKYIIPLLLLPFLTNAQSFEIKNESPTKVKVTADFKGKPEVNKEYTIKCYFHPDNRVRFIFMKGGKVIQAVDRTEESRTGVKWIPKKDEKLVILVKKT